MAFSYGKVGSNDDDQHPGPGRVTLWSRVCNMTSKLRWPSTYILLLVILAAQLQILRRQPPSMPLSSEINGLIPTFSSQQKKFLKDDRYNSDHRTASSIAATKANWLHLAPKGGGFVQVPDHRDHNLPPPMYFDEIAVLRGKDTYSIAVFHQIHCLFHVQAYMDALALQMRAGNTTLDERKLVHNDHCFNYLRNAVMCAADTTLEGQIEGDMWDGEAGTDGTGATHVCKNWDEVVAWAEKNRLYDLVHL